MPERWRGWSGWKLALFSLETVVLAGFVLLLVRGSELPGVLGWVGVVVGGLILLVGLVVGLFWLFARSGRGPQSPG